MTLTDLHQRYSDDAGTETDEMESETHHQTNDHRRTFLIPLHGNSDHLDGVTFTLAITRAWVRIMNSKQGSAQAPDLHQPPDLHQAIHIWYRSFCIMGHMQASVDWDYFMTTIAKGASRPIVMGCKCCGKVSRDESIILNFLWAIQNKQTEQAQGYLLQLIPADVSHKAMHYGLMFASKLQEAGLYFTEDIISAFNDQNYQEKMH